MLGAFQTVVLNGSAPADGGPGQRLMMLCLGTSRRRIKVSATRSDSAGDSLSGVNVRILRAQRRASSLGRLRDVEVFAGRLEVIGPDQVRSCSEQGVVRSWAELEQWWRSLIRSS